MQAFAVTTEGGFVPGVRRADEASGSPESAGGASAFLLNVLVIVTFVAGVALVVYGGVLAADGLNWELVAALALLAVLAERADMSLYGDSRISLAIVPIFATVIGVGMPGLAIVVPLAILASAYGRPLRKTALNFGALMLAAAAAAVVIPATYSTNGTLDWPQILLPATLAGTVNFAVNTLLVAAAIGLSSRSPLPKVWAEHFPWLLPHYIILAAIGTATVVAYQAMGLWGVAIFVAPPLMMRLSIKQYLDRTTKNVLDLRQAHVQLQKAHIEATEAMDRLRNAYDGTLRSLSAALDARDSETGGHSERVADLTLAIAAEMGFEKDTDEYRNLSWGALLHDVGKIAVPDSILRKPGALTADEWQTMRSHPAAGYEILLKIDFLKTASQIVLSHHERYDGGGYPRGLAGEEIPLGARIFTIADAFDAMTSDRAYRSAMPVEEALAEVLRNSGTQFDPAAVRAFLTVYQQRFVGTVHDSHLAPAQGGPGGHRELSESLKQAIAEAAGLDGEL